MRKDEVMKKGLRKFKGREGCSLSVSPRRRLGCRAPSASASARAGSIPWIDYTTAMVNFYYFYCVDEDFGPFFIKFCSYFPYTGKLCLNGHEYFKRQLRSAASTLKPSITGFCACEPIERAQRIAEGFR